MHRPNDTQFASMGLLGTKNTKYLLDNHRTSAQCRLIKGNTTVINLSQFPKYSCRMFEVSCDNKKNQWRSVNIISCAKCCNQNMFNNEVSEMKGFQFKFTTLVKIRYVIPFFTFEVSIFICELIFFLHMAI